MSANKKSFEKPLYKKYLTAVLLGSGAGMAALLAVIGLFALVLSVGGLTSSAAPVFSVASLCAGAFVCGFFVARRLREKGLLMGAVSGIWMFLLCCIAGLLFGKTQLHSAMAARLVISAVCAAIGGVVGVNVRLRKLRRN
ncbi:MAG: TIGR04086 family membrane protein [Oscillospiraceae bacterium]|nr:TIGR04086 family membrane protein [Oscillospiraceae bacterium]MBQ3050116.1 TIGR04086 family membrane protein [Oscillospiraceae bacterium]MBQ9939080.1 TIGR04086 family membrane protein [Oscillospiraceae bacterium]